MAKKNDGWSVHLTEHRELLLLPGGHDRPGYVFLGWTAGNKADGRALLAEVAARRAQQTARMYGYGA